WYVARPPSPALRPLSLHDPLPIFEHGLGDVRGFVLILVLASLAYPGEECVVLHCCLLLYGSLLVMGVVQRAAGPAASVRRRIAALAHSLDPGLPLGLAQGTAESSGDPGAAAHGVFELVAARRTGFLECLGDLFDLVVEALFGHGGRTACRSRGAGHPR